MRLAAPWLAGWLCVFAFAMGCPPASCALRSGHPLHARLVHSALGVSAARHRYKPAQLLKVHDYRPSMMTLELAKIHFGLGSLFILTPGINRGGHGKLKRALFGNFIPKTAGSKPGFEHFHVDPQSGEPTCYTYVWPLPNHAPARGLAGLRGRNVCFISPQHTQACVSDLQVPFCGCDWPSRRHRRCALLHNALLNAGLAGGMASVDMHTDLYQAAAPVKDGNGRNFSTKPHTNDRAYVLLEMPK